MQRNHRKEDKMRLTYGLLLLVSAVMLAQPPTNILVYYDNQLGYGTAVLNAIDNLWPSATVSAHNGDYAGFNNALNSGGANWDIVILECWYNSTNNIYFGGVADLYDTGAAKIFFSSWQLTGSYSGFLASAMGISSASAISGSVIPHYAWDTGHDICEGITDWTWANPGLGILNNRLTVSNATPVTGWTSSPSGGQAGICVANDGSSVISGYTPAYATQGEAIWENILGFMWGDVALTRSTWGEIKASF